jgi:hypothetical protein
MRDFECVTKSASSPDHIRAAARSSSKLTTNYREALLLFVGAHGFEFDVTKFPNRRAVTVPCGKQRFRFAPFGLDPAVLDARQQHRRWNVLNLRQRF